MENTAIGNVWVFIEQEGGKIADVSLELVCKGRELADQLGVKVEALLLGDKIEHCCATLFQYGCDNVFLVEDPRLEPFTVLPFAKVIVDLIREHRLRIDDFDDKLHDKYYKNKLMQIRPAFGGNIIATIVNTWEDPQMVTVREGVMKMGEPDTARTGTITRVTPALTAQEMVVKVIERVRQEKTVNLKGAQIIVAGGYGVGSASNFKLIHELAKTLGGQVGASRAAVDAGWIDHDHQIGQTGVTVRPKLYIACGISGSVQHRAGMAESKKIIAINTDPAAPIFSVAHYGIIGDLNQVIPMMIKAYKSKA